MPWQEIFRIFWRQRWDYNKITCNVHVGLEIPIIAAWFRKSHWTWTSELNRNSTCGGSMKCNINAHLEWTWDSRCTCRSWSVIYKMCIQNGQGTPFQSIGHAHMNNAEQRKSFGLYLVVFTQQHKFLKHLVKYAHGADMCNFILS